MKTEKQGQEFERTINDRLSYGVNEIIKNVSPDRAYVISVLDYLRNCNLVKEDNNNWSIGTKKKIKPTLLGLEIVDIIEGMNKYRIEVNKLLNAYGKHVEYFLNKYQNKIIDIIKDKKSKGEKIEWHDLIDYYKVIGKVGSQKQKEARKYHDFDKTVQSALYHLQANELPALISAYPRIYYSYKKQMTEETAEFLRNIIYNEINKQLKIWVETSTTPQKFIRSNENVVDDYGFIRMFSGRLVKNLMEVYTQYALDADDKLGLNIDDAVVSLFQISKPLDEGGQVYLDPEKRREIESSDLALLENMTKHKKSNKTVPVKKEEETEEEDDFDFIRLISQFDYYREIEDAKLEFRSKHFS